MPQFVSSSDLPCSASSLRSFLGRTANLPAISNPDLELQIVAAPENVTVGESIQFRISVMGFKQRATNKYVSVTPLEIIEEQTDGPMRAWKHVQRIEPIDDGNCRLTDEVTFERPGGMLSFVMTEDRVREQLEEGMAFRYDALRELIAAGDLT